MPVQKAKNFKVTLKRLIGYLKPHRFALFIVFATAVLSTVFSILGPKIMGKATTKLFEGLVAKMNGVPGAKIDFGYIWQILARLSRTLYHQRAVQLHSAICYGECCPEDGHMTFART